LALWKKTFGQPLQNPLFSPLEKILLAPLIKSTISPLEKSLPKAMPTSKDSYYWGRATRETVCDGSGIFKMKR